MKIYHFNTMNSKEYIDYLRNENKFLKDKLLEISEDVNKAYQRGLKEGFDEAIKEISKHD